MCSKVFPIVGPVRPSLFSWGLLQLDLYPALAASYSGLDPPTGLDEAHHGPGLVSPPLCVSGPPHQQLVLVSEAQTKYQTLCTSCQQLRRYENG